MWWAISTTGFNPVGFLPPGSYLDYIEVHLWLGIGICGHSVVQCSSKAACNSARGLQLGLGLEAIFSPQSRWGMCWNQLLALF